MSCSCSFVNPALFNIIQPMISSGRSILYFVTCLRIWWNSVGYSRIDWSFLRCNLKKNWSKWIGNCRHTPIACPSAWEGCRDLSLSPARGNQDLRIGSRMDPQGLRGYWGLSRSFDFGARACGHTKSFASAIQHKSWWCCRSKHEAILQILASVRRGAAAIRHVTWGSAARRRRNHLLEPPPMRKFRCQYKNTELIVRIRIATTRNIEMEKKNTNNYLFCMYATRKISKGPYINVRKPRKQWPSAKNCSIIRLHGVKSTQQS